MYSLILLWALLYKIVVKEKETMFLLLLKLTIIKKLSIEDYQLKLNVTYQSNYI